MKNILKDLALAVLAGMAIAIGGAVFLSLDNKVAGAVMFSVGLYTICAHGLNLYTGKIGYLAIKSGKELPGYLGFLLTVWLGNFAGTALSALLLSFTRVGAALSEKAAAICEVKQADSLASLLILGIFCGLLMYAAVEGYKLTKNPIILVFCVAVFILCGFEHCIADMFYFSMAAMINGKTLAALIAITLGNSIGGMLIPAASRLK